MKNYPDFLFQLINAISKLPGIGKRSAERIVFYLLKTRAEEVQQLSVLLGDLRKKTLFCERCHFFSDEKLCHVCSDPGRDQGIICVVEDAKDVIAFEKTGTFMGTYHVLLGALSALEGIGPSELQIQKLIERVKAQKVREVVIATNPNTDGETTALYLAKVLKQMGVKASRIAHGVPVGSLVEFSDQATLSRALEGRQEV